MGVNDKYREDYAFMEFYGLSEAHWDAYEELQDKVCHSGNFLRTAFLARVIKVKETAFISFRKHFTFENPPNKLYFSEYNGDIFITFDEPVPRFRWGDAGLKSYPRTLQRTGRNLATLRIPIPTKLREAHNLDGRGMVYVNKVLPRVYRLRYYDTSPDRPQ